MARGQYDLPPNRAPAAYGPQRPPTTTSRPSRSSSHDSLVIKQSRPNIVVLASSATAVNKTQLLSIRTRIDPDATIQIVDDADTAIAALFRKPSAVVVLNNAANQPSFEFARPGLLRYAQQGGRVVTDLSAISLFDGRPPHHNPAHLIERPVEYDMESHVSDMHAEHLVA